MKKLKKFDFKPVASFGAQQSKYDWNTLLDGGTYELEVADLKHTQPKFIGLLRWKAKLRGQEVQYNKTAEGGVVIKAGPADESKAAEFKEHLANKKAEAKARKAAGLPTDETTEGEPTE